MSDPTEASQGAQAQQLLEIVVTDDAGVPIPRCDVAVTGPDGTPHRTRGDERGRTTVRLTTFGATQVTCTAPGYAAVFQGVETPGGVLHVVLRPLSTLGGVVRSGDGKPLAGASLVVVHDSPGRTETHRVRANSSGRFQFQEAARGVPYTIRPGAGLAGKEVDVVAPAPDLEIIWAMESGVLISAAGRRGATWWVFPDKARGSPLATGTLTGTAAQIQVPLASGPYVVRVSDAPGNTQYRSEFHVSAGVVNVDVPAEGADDQSSLIVFVNPGDTIAAAQLLHTTEPFCERYEMSPHSESEARVRAGRYTIVSAVFPGAPVQSDLEAVRGEGQRFVLPERRAAGTILRFDIAIEAGQSLPLASIQLTPADDRDAYPWVVIYGADRACIDSARNAVPINATHVEIAIEEPGRFDYVLSMDGFKPLSGTVADGARIVCAPERSE